MYNKQWIVLDSLVAIYSGAWTYLWFNQLEEESDCNPFFVYFRLLSLIVSIALLVVTLIMAPICLIVDKNSRNDRERHWFLDFTALIASGCVMGTIVVIFYALLLWIFGDFDSCGYGLSLLRWSFFANIIACGLSVYSVMVLAGASGMRYL